MDDLTNFVNFEDQIDITTWHVTSQTMTPWSWLFVRRYTGTDSSKLPFISILGDGHQHLGVYVPSISHYKDFRISYWSWPHHPQYREFRPWHTYRTFPSTTKSVRWKSQTGWWFQICFIFTPIWGRFPIWLIFFRWVETTNQLRFVGTQSLLSIFSQFGYLARVGRTQQLTSLGTTILLKSAGGILMYFEVVVFIFNPQDPCMIHWIIFIYIYLPTFTIKTSQMYVNILYIMDPYGEWNLYLSEKQLRKETSPYWIWHYINNLEKVAQRWPQ